MENQKLDFSGVVINKTTRNRLRKAKLEGETYDNQINRLLDMEERKGNKGRKEKKNDSATNR